MAFRDNLQPWSSFLNPSSFCSPEPNEIITRVQGNLEYFASNYIVMFLIIFIGSLLSKPYFLLCMIFISSAWIYLHSMNKLVIQGFEVETIHKNLVMLGVSSIALLIFAWNAIFISALVFTIFGLAHAVFHVLPSPNFELEPEVTV